ncbi:MAG: phosphate acyltransferase PlsX [Alphaproteobacteria bacterium]
MITVALDAMGGDQAPALVISGAQIALKEIPDIKLLFFGDKEQLMPLISQAKLDTNRIEVHHTDEVITNEVKPSVAMRKGQNSSMSLAIKAVRNGDADCIVSAGNTGALMALGLFHFRMLPGIDRPAIAAVISGFERDCLMLDLGANAECSSRNLVEFASMGHVYAESVLSIENPRIGLLNIGAEGGKGNKLIQEVHNKLQGSHLGLNYTGFVEGDDIANGTVDIIITDGFTGNVALKSIEGTLRAGKNIISKEIKGSLAAKIGLFIAQRALRKAYKRVDPRRYNGAWLLGLNGVCVKSHGGTDEFGFYNAIKNAYLTSKKDLLPRLKQHLENHQADYLIEEEGL